VRAAAERSVMTHGGTTTRKKQRCGGFTGAEATKHGQEVMASDTAGREWTWEASDSAAATSDRAGRERGVASDTGAAAGRRFMARARAAVSAWCSAWHARWRQCTDERAWRGEREADRWDPVTDFVPN
jgi:hypothetical protein